MILDGALITLYSMIHTVQFLEREAVGDTNLDAILAVWFMLKFSGTVEDLNLLL